MSSSGKTTGAGSSSFAASSSALSGGERSDRWVTRGSGEGGRGARGEEEGGEEAGKSDLGGERETGDGLGIGAKRSSGSHRVPTATGGGEERLRRWEWTGGGCVGGGCDGGHCDGGHCDGGHCDGRASCDGGGPSPSSTSSIDAASSSSGFESAWHADMWVW